MAEQVDEADAQVPLTEAFATHAGVRRQLKRVAPAVPAARALVVEDVEAPIRPFDHQVERGLDQRALVARPIEELELAGRRPASSVRIWR